LALQRHHFSQDRRKQLEVTLSAGSQPRLYAPRASPSQLFHQLSWQSLASMVGATDFAKMRRLLWIELTVAVDLT
jgi:hypothetical protein